MGRWKRLKAALRVWDSKKAEMVFDQEPPLPADQIAAYVKAYFDKKYPADNYDEGYWLEFLSYYEFYEKDWHEQNDPTPEPEPPPPGPEPNPKPKPIPKKKGPGTATEFSKFRWGQLKNELEAWT